MLETLCNELVISFNLTFNMFLRPDCGGSTFVGGGSLLGRGTLAQVSGVIQGFRLTLLVLCDI